MLGHNFKSLTNLKQLRVDIKYDQLLPDLEGV